MNKFKRSSALFPPAFDLSWPWPGPGSEASVAHYTVAPVVLQAIETHIGLHRAERGAMLGGSRARNEVTAIHIDLSAHTAGAEYTPDIEVLNRLLKEWNAAGIDLIGFVHSHPRGVRRPSGADEEYAGRILGWNSAMGAMLMPIVMTEPDAGAYELLGYAATLDRSDRVVVGPASLKADPALNAAARVSAGEAPSTKKPDIGASASAGTVRLEQLRARVADAYDVTRLERTRVVVMGVGGARGLVESLARCFVGEFVLIDHDVSSAGNVGTQAAFVDEIGQPKVSALTERIHAINPYARVGTHPCRAEEIDINGWRRLLTPSGEVEHVALLIMTDNFEAQALGNRLALHFAVPSVAAGMYRRGEGCEVTFTHPDVTPACHRCALSSRYEAYVNGYQSDVTSQGTAYPFIDIFNGLIGYVTLAVLHHGSSHERWGGLLQRFGNRNLVLAGLWPDFSLNSIDKALRAADPAPLLGPRVVWCAQPGDHPKNDPAWAQCPDCGGHGNLRAAAGSFAHDLGEIRRQVPRMLRDAPTTAAPTDADTIGM